MNKKRSLDKKVKHFSLRQFFLSYWLLLLLLLTYTALMLSTLSWGTPNGNHPFTYHMDEWHQLMAVKALFKEGSPNTPGAAHGSVFFFLTSGLYLGPWYVLKIVDPFVIKSSLSSLDMQQRLFEVLRISSILYGIGSILLIWELSKKYLKTNPFISSFFFTFSPAFIMLSNYFKYDIALLFWIVASLYALFRFYSLQTKKAFLIAAVPIALSIATKVSAAPLVPIYIFSYYFFTPPKQRNSKNVVIGIGISTLLFCIFGIPDIFFRTAAYIDHFTINLVSVPAATASFLLGMPVWVYLPFVVYPVLFGHGLYFLFLASLVYFVVQYIRQKSNKNTKEVIFLFVSFLFFAGSLIPLQLFAIGNRPLVLLPFLVLFVGMFWKTMLQTQWKKLFIGLLFVAMCIQSFEVFAWVWMKIGTNPRIEASNWMINTLSKQQTIGVENIPIYQNLPELTLKEFYTLDRNPKAKTNFKYTLVDEKTKNLPKTIVITDAYYESHYLADSPKKRLVTRLKKEGYKEIKRFNPDWKYYTYFAREQDLNLVTIIPLIPISLYQKQGPDVQ